MQTQKSSLLLNRLRKKKYKVIKYNSNEVAQHILKGKYLVDVLENGVWT